MVLHLCIHNFKVLDAIDLFLKNGHTKSKMVAAGLGFSLKIDKSSLKTFFTPNMTRDPQKTVNVMSGFFCYFK